MKEEIKVSIIIPVYNVEKYLRKCIESALNQTLDNIEIIAVNDGSTDNSLKILNEYENIYENFKVINQVNMGVGSARNTGLKKAIGKYIYFLDSDDYIAPEFIELMTKKADKTNCDVVFCEKNRAEVAMFDAGVFLEKDLKNNNLNFNYNRKDVLGLNVVKGEELFCELIKKKVYKSPVWLFFYDRQFLKNNKLTFYNGIIHEDELFTPQALIKSNRIIYIPKDLFFRRVRNDSIMTKKIGRKNIEGYYQEIGRAGRDGEKSECILLFSPSDIHTQKYLIEVSTENIERKNNQYLKLKQMVDLIYSNDCYRKYILNYFGESVSEDCNNCSSCLSEGELVDKTIDAQKVLSCIYRMKKSFGVAMVVDVLRGSKNKKVLHLSNNNV